MRVIVSTLGYVLSTDRRQALLIHRNARPDDRHYGKYNGLGGKLEPNEDLAAGMRREIREEANIDCRQLELAGTIMWRGLELDGADCFAALFRITEWNGSPPVHNSEGELVWTAVTDMLASRLPMWPGDRHFLPLIFADRPRQFHGIMHYFNGLPADWVYSEL